MLIVSADSDHTVPEVAAVLARGAEGVPDALTRTDLTSLASRRPWAGTSDLAEALLLSLARSLRNRLSNQR